jgi:hypothetical protein
MEQPFRTPFRMTVLLLCLMSLQSTSGLVFRDAYRDAPWIKAAWLGNDVITLVVAVPLTIGALIYARAGSAGGTLLWLGALAYAVYNYAFYMLGVELNEFFVLYVLALLTASISLLLVLVRLDVHSLAGCFIERLPARLIGGYFVFVAAALALVWLGMWAAAMFFGAELPVESSAFRLVAALDFTLMVPILMAGGILLWRRHPWGYVIAAVAGVQGTLYLLVLSVNSAVAIHRGFVEPPGEAPVWATLGLFTAIATTLLLGNASRRIPIHARPSRG